MDAFTYLWDFVGASGTTISESEDADMEFLHTPDQTNTFGYVHNCLVFQWCSCSFQFRQHVLHNFITTQQHFPRILFSADDQPYEPTATNASTLRREWSPCSIYVTF